MLGKAVEGSGVILHPAAVIGLGFTGENLKLSNGPLKSDTCIRFVSLIAENLTDIEEGDGTIVDCVEIGMVGSEIVFGLEMAESLFGGSAKKVEAADGLEGLMEIVDQKSNGLFGLHPEFFGSFLGFPGRVEGQAVFLVLTLLFLNTPQDVCQKLSSNLAGGEAVGLNFGEGEIALGDGSLGKLEDESVP
jgi:hypothetical protein